MDLCQIVQIKALRLKWISLVHTCFIHVHTYIGKPLKSSSEKPKSQVFDIWDGTLSNRPLQSFVQMVALGQKWPYSGCFGFKNKINLTSSSPELQTLEIWYKALPNGPFAKFVQM